MKFFTKLFKKKSLTEIKKALEEEPKNLLYGKDLSEWEFLFSRRIVYKVGPNTYWNSVAFFCKKGDEYVRDYSFIYDTDRNNLSWQDHSDIKEYAVLWKANQLELITYSIDFEYDAGSIFYGSYAMKKLNEMGLKVTKRENGKVAVVRDSSLTKNAKYIDALKKQKEEKKNVVITEATTSTEEKNNVIKIDFKKKDVDKE